MVGTSNKWWVGNPCWLNPSGRKLPFCLGHGRVATLVPGLNSGKSGRREMGDHVIKNNH